MTPVTPWFQRTFPASLSPELLPGIASRLKGTPARLYDTFLDIDPAVSTKRPERGWSMQEHAGHMLDLEPLWLRRVEDFLSGNSQLTAADLQNRQTDAANHNARPLPEILNAFKEERSKLIQRILGIDARQTTARIKHPRLEIPMGITDHLHFVAEHDDHHLATIEALLRSA